MWYYTGNMGKIKNVSLIALGMALTATLTFTLLFSFNRPIETPENRNNDPVSLPEEPIPEEITYTITFTGDISLADNWHIAPKYDERGGITGILGSTMLETMKDSDFLVVNSEFTVSNRGAPLRGKMYTFRAKPERLTIYQ